MNVYQLVEACETGAQAYPLFIQRDSWAPTTLLEVVGVAPDWKDWPGSDPYWGNQPCIYGWLHTRGKYLLAEVSCAGTGGYKRVGQPSWWFPPAYGSIALSNGQKVALE